MSLYDNGGQSSFSVSEHGWNRHDFGDCDVGIDSSVESSSYLSPDDSFDDPVDSDSCIETDNTRQLKWKRECCGKWSKMVLISRQHRCSAVGGNHWSLWRGKTSDNGLDLFELPFEEEWIDRIASETHMPQTYKKRTVNNLAMCRFYKNVRCIET